MTPEVIKSLSDLGMHFSQADIQEAELRAAGWRPVAQHPRSVVWITPDGALSPGLGYSWSVMKAAQSKV